MKKVLANVQAGGGPPLSSGKKAQKIKTLRQDGATLNAFLTTGRILVNGGTLAERAALLSHWITAQAGTEQFSLQS
jgi:hypothetical protein